MVAGDEGGGLDGVANSSEGDVMVMEELMVRSIWRLSCSVCLDVDVDVDDDGPDGSTHTKRLKLVQINRLSWLPSSARRSEC